MCQADQYGSLNFITAFTFLLILVPSRRLKKHCNFLFRPNSACFKSVSLIKSKAPHEKVTFLKLDLGLFSWGDRWKLLKNHFTSDLLFLNRGRWLLTFMLSRGPYKRLHSREHLIFSCLHLFSKVKKTSSSVLAF